MAGEKTEKAGRGVNIIIISACVILITVGIISVKYIADTESACLENEEESREIQEAYVSINSPEVKTEEAVVFSFAAPENEMDEQETEQIQFPVSVDFEGLQEVNSCVIGWIYSEGMVISYPVVIGTDNLYYLSHSVRGTESAYGTVFADSGNSPSFSDPNTILYAHRMNDGSMFGTVTEYKKQEYYDEHPVMWLATLSQNYRVDIYSCYCTASDSEAYTLRFSDVDSYADWLAETVEKSVIETDIVPNITSHVLTLSTCSYEFNGARTVVHGILMPVQ